MIARPRALGPANYGVGRVFEALFSIECCLTALDLILLVAEVRVTHESAPNRQARRAARRGGLPVPPVDRWTIMFVVGLVVVCALTAYLILRLAGVWPR